MVTHGRIQELAVIGGFAAAALVGFVALFMTMTNRALNAERSDLWVALPAADGLRRGDAVLHRGVQVGEVRRLAFDEHERVVVQAKLTQRVPLTIAARAELVAVDVFGRQSLVLLAGSRVARPLADGDTIVGDAPLSLTGRIEGMGARVERMLGDSTIDLVHGVLTGVEGAAHAVERLMLSSASLLNGRDGSFAIAAHELSGTLANLNAATDSAALRELRTALLGTAVGMERVVARLDTATLALSRSLGRIEDGGGTIGRLTGDDELYVRALAALTGVEELIADVKRDPKRYFSIKVF